MSVTYIKLGPLGDAFTSKELGIFLTPGAVYEINDDLVSTRLKSFFLTGFLVRITQVEYDNLKLNNSNARNIPLVTIDLAETSYQEPVETVLNVPPVNPIKNRRYLIWDKPLGSWETYENCIAWFTGIEWNFIIPTKGMTVPIYSLGISAKYTGTYPSGKWVIGDENTTEQNIALLNLINSNINNPTEYPIPDWILNITQSDIDRWNSNAASGGNIGNPLDPDDPFNYSDYSNEELLRALNEMKGYLLIYRNKIKAGWADIAGEWGPNHYFEDYMDQPVKVDSHARFRALSSREFVSGFAGAGWMIDQYGNATFDNLTVRKEFNVYELVINKISGSNGAIAVTDSAEIWRVLDHDEFNWHIEIDTKEGTIQVPFRVNDLLRCQRWNGKGIKYYFARVTDYGSGWFRLSKTDIEGQGRPEKGDSVHRFGNTTNTDRQGLLYLTSSDDYSPYMDILDGVTSSNLAGKTRVRLGKLDGIVDAVYGPLKGYGLYTDNGYFRGTITVIGTGSNVPTKNEVEKALEDISGSITTPAEIAQQIETAKSESLAYAKSQAIFEAEKARVYADGLVTAEEDARIREAEANLKAAKDDALAKYAAAVAASQGYTDQKTVAIYNDAVRYIDTEIQNGVATANAAVLLQASNDAKAKADAARDEAVRQSTLLVAGLATPQQVADAVRNAEEKANAAQIAYQNLTAQLKPMAFTAIEDLAYMGQTVFSGGYIRATLLDIAYIRANVVNVDALIARSIETQGQNFITLNKDNDNLLRFRHPNGRIGIEMGILGGELLLNWYDPQGNLVWQGGNSGVKYIVQIPSSTTPVKQQRVHDVTELIPTGAARESLISGVRATFRYDPGPYGNEGYSHPPQYVKMAPSAPTYYLYNNGRNPESDDTLQYNGVHISMDMTSPFVPDGWYVYPAEVGRKLHTTDWNGPGQQQVICTAHLFIGGQRVGSETFPVILS